MNITVDTTLLDLRKSELLGEAARYFVGSSDPDFYKIIENDSSRIMEEHNPAWAAEEIVYGLKRLEALAERNICYFHQVYSDEEIEEEPVKACVRFFYFPADNPITDRYVILTAGGAYNNVCSLSESFPVAARLNELGISAVCINYRTCEPSTKKEGLMPKPLDDVAAAFHYIKEHKDLFKINPERYIMCGFSAGGHLAGMWGTKHMGYKKYGLPKPEAIFLNYAFITAEEIIDTESVYQFMAGIIGEAVEPAKAELFYVNRHVDMDYPPTYLVHCMDDPLVPIHNMYKMKNALNAAGVPNSFESGKIGGHGYGLGGHTSVAGWLERAIKFWQDISI